MTVIQINTVASPTTSTGRIMGEISLIAGKAGWKSYIAFGRGRQPATTEAIRIGGKGSQAIHLAASRLFDSHGLASRNATLRLLHGIDLIRPDIIHLHNIHGYYLNYPLLFDYLRRKDIPVVWTLHDCWAYTGHCYHYTATACSRWQHGCGSCHALGTFPSSLFADRSARNYIDKQKVFTSLNERRRLTLVCVSRWMREELKKSFFSSTPIIVIPNGVDLTVFRPETDEESRRRIRERYSIPLTANIIMASAAHWNTDKGIHDLEAVAGNLNENEVLMIAGLTSRQAHAFRGRFVNAGQISDVHLLARLYSEASVLVNPTHQDNYPTVNLEAQACGTPVVTYDVGGSAESLLPMTGEAVPPGDISRLLAGIRRFCRISGKEYAVVSNICRMNAEKRFDKSVCFSSYPDLYYSLV